MELNQIGQRDSYEAFVAATLPELGRLAVALTGNPHDGMDLLQDALIRLARAWERVDTNADVRAYARSTLVRLNINRIRARGRDVRLVARAALHTPAAPEEGPYLGLEPWLEDALEQLSPRQRTAVALVHLCGLSPESAAETMSCRTNTLKTHLERGMSRLRVAAEQKGARYGAAAGS